MMDLIDRIFETTSICRGFNIYDIDYLLMPHYAAPNPAYHHTYAFMRFMPQAKSYRLDIEPEENEEEII